MLYPEIGKWFRRPDGALLEVVAVDEDDRTIEIQMFDGTIDEIDATAWRELNDKGEFATFQAPHGHGDGTPAVEFADDVGGFGARRRGLGQPEGHFTSVAGF